MRWVGLNESSVFSFVIHQLKQQQRQAIIGRGKQSQLFRLTIFSTCRCSFHPHFHPHFHPPHPHHCRNNYSRFSPAPFLVLLVGDSLDLGDSNNRLFALLPATQLPPVQVLHNHSPHKNHHFTLQHYHQHQHLQSHLTQSLLRRTSLGPCVRHILYPI